MSNTPDLNKAREAARQVMLKNGWAVSLYKEPRTMYEQVKAALATPTTTAEPTGPNPNSV